MEMTETADTLWTKKFRFDVAAYFNDVIEASDNNLMIAAHLDGPDGAAIGDACLIKTNFFRRYLMDEKLRIY